MRVMDGTPDGVDPGVGGSLSWSRTFRRARMNQAKPRSTNQRWGRTTKAWASGGRFTILMEARHHVQETSPVTCGSWQPEPRLSAGPETAISRDASRHKLIRVDTSSLIQNAALGDPSSVRQVAGLGRDEHRGRRRPAAKRGQGAGSRASPIRKDAPLECTTKRTR